MTTLLHARTRRFAVTALVAVVGATACQDAEAPLAPAAPDAILSESTLDVASQQVDRQQESNVGQMDRQRDRARDGQGRTFDRVGLAVDFADAAVSRAGRIPEAEGADDRQAALYDEAERHLRAAQAALAAGDHAAAVRPAQPACATALTAWTLPGGPTRDEAEAVPDPATELLTEAAAQVGAADGIRGTILGWAAGFHTHGAAQLDAGNLRGVVGLWKAAALSFYLVA